ncbi:BamA/TamA family outer membrane protein [Terriglobus albidus]|uniref:BamA/TamA family outer membrane protein n=1 Tax=Terriglobus albidus TaxID=1592106 RepID=A0A5B9EFT6_9BACT|nr:BamA/TamA family outer membrane protein [Terriglobus albidus]QEE28906.1 BamA/TamA family outer membrane protein [Terriglobus albidus]
MTHKMIQIVAISSAVTLSCVSGFAQEPLVGSTRSATIAESERAKARSLSPVGPSHGEQEFDRFEKRIINPVVNPNGLIPKLGGLPTGGGFSLGPGYVRRDLLWDHLVSDSYIVGSTKKWYRAESSLDLINLLDDHLEFHADGAYENAASMPYYGVGSNSIKENRSDFRREFTTAHFGGQCHFVDRKLAAGYAVGGLLVNVGPGDLSDWPSADKLFNEANTPGLQRQSNFITGTASVTADFTTPSFSSPKGLILEASDTQFWDRSGNHSDFHRLQTQATYYVPFLNGMRTLAFRARNETTFPTSGQQVPFYLQPTIGGPNDLRGYERYRYYGNGSSVLNGEYRWSVAGSLELAIFGDGGNVYSRPGLVGLRELRGDGGFGVRIKSKQQEVVRVDLGVSPEGVKVWFVFNNAFGRLFRSF